MVQLRQEWINGINVMQREMSRLLDYFADAKPPMVRFSPTVWEPAIDLFEADDELVVTVELAGVKEDDFEMMIDHNIFTIRGERRKEVPEGSAGAYYQMEIVSGSFERSINLPVLIDAASARASYEDGLVEVALPKVKERRTVRVEIKVK